MPSWAGSIAAKAARRFDGAQFVEIDFDNGLQRFAGCRALGRLRHLVEPGSTLRLYGKEIGDGIVPSLLSLVAVPLYSVT